ncbi:unnamed protein product, partial [Brassica oleracea]
MHSFSFLTMVETCNTHLCGLLQHSTVEQWESRLRVMSPTNHLSTITELLEEAEAMIKNITVEEATIIWSSLFSICWKNGNIEMAER